MEQKQKGRFYYGWVILGCCMIITACSTGVLSYFGALFVQPVTEGLGVNKATFMLYSTCSTITTMIGMPIAGALYKRFAVKPLMLLGTAFGVGAMLVYSFSPTVYGFYVGGVMGGVGMCLYGALPMTIVLNNWFIEKRGLVTGIAFTGSAIISALMSPVISGVITERGYPSAYRLMALLIAGLMIPMTLFFFRIRPEEMGLQPYGEEKAAASAGKTGFSRPQAMRSPAFWLFAVSVFLIGFATFGTQNHLIAYWGTVGVEAGAAARLYSLVMAASAFAKMMLGGLYDRVGVAKGSTMLCLVGACALFSLLLCTSGWPLLVSAVLFGMMTSLQVLVPSFVASRLFGEKEYASIYGVMNTVLFCGVSVGVPFSGLIFDCFGTYRPAWLLYGGLMLLSLAALLAANRVSKRIFRSQLGIERLD